MVSGIDPRSGKRRRHHVDEKSLQRAVKKAVREAGSLNWLHILDLVWVMSCIREMTIRCFLGRHWLKASSKGSQYHQLHRCSRMVRRKMQPFSARNWQGSSLPSPSLKGGNSIPKAERYIRSHQSKRPFAFVQFGLLHVGQTSAVISSINGSRVSMPVFSSKAKRRIISTSQG